MADTFNKAAIRTRCANLPFFFFFFPEVYAGAFVSQLKAQLDAEQK